jgi:DNA-binding beta-propeller fold protein YncE
MVAAATLIGLTVGSVPSGATGGATSPPTAYVTNTQLTTVSVFTGSAFSGTVPNVGSGPTGIAIDSQNKTAYVADYGFLDQPAHTVTPIDLATQTAGKPITVGSGPLAIAIRPGGRFAVVTLQGTPKYPGHQIREINLTTRAVSGPVDVGVNPESLAIAPNGQMAYVADFSSAEVTPVNLTTWPPRAEAPIKLKGTSPRAIAITPGGGRAYVLDATHATIIPISLPSDKVGTPFDLVCRAEGDPGCTPSALTISPDGRTAYVAAAGSGDVVMLALPSLALVGVVETGAYPDALGLSGQWLYVANGESNTMSVFSGLGSPRTIGDVTYPFGVAVVPGSGSTSRTEASVRTSTEDSVRPRGASRAAAEAHAAPFYGLSRA